MNNSSALVVISPNNFSTSGFLLRELRDPAVLYNQACLNEVAPSHPSRAANPLTNETKWAAYSSVVFEPARTSPNFIFGSGT